MVGETLSRYRITARLGAGAMCEVYLAEDLRLLRPVALKIFPLSGGGRDASRRLLAEARAASALTHPNVAVVYEVDEVERDGARVGFIAMEYVAGRTLADFAREETPALDLVLDIGRQIADALADAHEHGLVHRDIKPSNVMITASGRVKVLDFGLASWSAPVTGVDLSTKTADPFDGATNIAGTLPYMSPEQATGRTLDGRSDMFSLGIMLYELIGGDRPFGGANVMQLIEALLQQEVPPLVARIDDPRLSAVERVLRRMLEKLPSHRYDNLRAAAEALEAAGRDQTSLEAGADTRPPILAVTDFRNITANAEDDWLGTGMAETISSDLGSLDGVTVIPRGRVHELIRTLGHETAGSDDLVRLRAGRQLGARWVLAGSFQRAAQAVRVTASLIDVASGAVAHTIKVDGQLTGIFALQDRLVRDLADGLRAVMRPGDATTQETGIVGAYEAFSKGVVNLQAETYESLDRAVMLFERAVALDARYARAHLELGVAYSTKADYLAMADLRPRAEASLRRALELQPGAVRGWRELGLLLIAMGREPEGFEAIDHALDLDAGDAGALGAMARALFVGRAQFHDAASWYDKALAANPNGGWYALQLSHCAALLREFARGEAAANRAVALQQAFLSGREGVLIVGASMRLGHLEALQGHHARAVDYFLREIEFLSSVDHALRNRIIVELNVRLGASYLALGQARKSHAVLDVAIEGFDRRVRLGADEPFTRYYAAAAHALKGDADAAIAFLERAAVERRAFTVERARIEPEFDGLRDDPRFKRLLVF
jgi:eukaryotic-like serine/threonine-protein kinase